MRIIVAIKHGPASTGKASPIQPGAVGAFFHTGVRVSLAAWRNGKAFDRLRPSRVLSPPLARRTRRVIRRAASLVLLVWALGFAWFALVLPQPLGQRSDEAAVVLTGGEGRIARAFDVLRKGWVRQVFVAGVDREVRPHEFAAQYRVPKRLMDCCVTLDQVSVDTRSNAHEAARWLAAHRVGSVRLVTSDWHMRRAARELARVAPRGTIVGQDAVRSRPSLRVLFLEYNKLVARWLGDAVGV